MVNPEEIEAARRLLPKFLGEVVEHYKVVPRRRSDLMGFSARGR